METFCRHLNADFSENEIWAGAVLIEGIIFETEPLNMEFLQISRTNKGDKQSKALRAETREGGKRFKEVI